MKNICFTFLCFFVQNIAFTQSINSMLSNSEILSKMYLNEGIQTDTIEWKGQTDKGQIQTLRTFVKFKEFYIQDGFLKCLIFTESNYQLNYCHGCGALLGGAVMRKEKGGWVIEILSKEIGWFGAWGKLGMGDFEGVKISEKNRGVVIKVAFGNFGEYAEYATIVGVLDNQIIR
jgi:hypothetical protein